VQHLPGPSTARAAGLTYISDAVPGFSRERRGEGFVYLRPDGRPVRDAATLARIRALVLPPAWTNVWIALSPDAHLQATGRDAAGRKQYRYHKAWSAQRDATKYGRMLAFADALPAIRRRTARDLREPVRSRARVLATVVQLLERTRIRVGNEEYARMNGSHGLTTLRGRHVAIKGDHLKFSFRAKSGVRQTVELDDARLARVVRQCQDLPGQMLFQYVDDDEQVRAVSSSDVNEYLRSVAGGAFTAKDFRTWAGTITAARALADLGPAASARDAARNVVTAVDTTAHALGNTRAVSRKCYIHPAVVDAYLAGVTIDDMPVRAVGGAFGLTRDELRVVMLLRRTERRRAAA
jgi:DNA topoisomerase-1